mmetsp:Transcript_7585/g.16603  ORF Transcript_7585/g.16603 Transcript_7585/m.16603 type:complete len:81 (+) Transcript_7585:135-377(+)
MTWGNFDVRGILEVRGRLSTDHRKRLDVMETGKFGCQFDALCQWWRVLAAIRAGITEAVSGVPLLVLVVFDQELSEGGPK